MQQHNRKLWSSLKESEILLHCDAFHTWPKHWESSNNDHQLGVWDSSRITFPPMKWLCSGGSGSVGSGGTNEGDTCQEAGGMLTQPHGSRLKSSLRAHIHLFITLHPRACSSACSLQWQLNTEAGWVAGRTLRSNSFYSFFCTFRITLLRFQTYLLKVT